MNGNYRWGTGAHPAGCDHLWSAWRDADETPVAYLGAFNIRWCLFCSTPEFEERS